MGSINRRQVMIELEAATPIIKKVAEVYVREEIFLPAVESMKNDFEQHAVTKELDDGAKYGNEAGSESGAVAVGKSKKNLFTFIGFNKGEKPTDAIRSSIGLGINGPKLISLPVVKRTFIYRFTILAPNLSEIYKKTPIPWATGLSWAKKVETGIDGLGSFIAKDGVGRSEGGIQTEKKIETRQKRSNPVDYLSGIISRFLGKIK